MAANRTINAALLGNELTFSTARSSGPGGQNVNKVSSKVIVKFDIPSSSVLTPEEKETLLRKLSTKLTTEGVLVISAQDKRSQLQNKEAVLSKLNIILAKAFEKKKVRKTTKPSRSSAEKRIKKKKLISEKKKWRQRP